MKKVAYADAEHDESLTPRALLIESVEGTGILVNYVVGAFVKIKRALAIVVAARGRRRAIDKAAFALSQLEHHILKDLGINQGRIFPTAKYVVDNPGADPRKYFAR